MTAKETRNKQRVLLVFAFLQAKEQEKQRRRRELSDIVRSCGGEVVDCSEQNLLRFHPATLIGKGKVGKLRDLRKKMTLIWLFLSRNFPVRSAFIFQSAFPVVF